jgi:hypothetical protein
MFAQISDAPAERENSVGCRCRSGPRWLPATPPSYVGTMSRGHLDHPHQDGTCPVSIGAW